MLATAAVATIFIEGTPYDRSILDEEAPPRPEPSLKDHPLVKHYGLPIEALALTKAHRKVEGEHRQSAWKIILDHVDNHDRPCVLSAMEEALCGWLNYRNEVAAACGLSR